MTAITATPVIQPFRYAFFTFLAPFASCWRKDWPPPVASKPSLPTKPWFRLGRKNSASYHAERLSAAASPSSPRPERTRHTAARSLSSSCVPSGLEGPDAVGDQYRRGGWTKWSTSSPSAAAPATQLKAINWSWCMCGQGMSSPA